MKRQKSKNGTPDLYSIPFVVCGCISSYTHTHTHTHKYTHMHAVTQYLHTCTYRYRYTHHIHRDTEYKCYHRYTYTYTYIYLALVCSHSVMSNSLWPRKVARQASLSVEFFRQNTGVVAVTFSRGIFPTQGLNPCLLCLLHYRQILCCLNHQGSPRL